MMVKKITAITISLLLIFISIIPSFAVDESAELEKEIETEMSNETPEKDLSVDVPSDKPEEEESSESVKETAEPAENVKKEEATADDASKENDTKDTASESESKDVQVTELEESNNALLLKRNLMAKSLMKSAMPNGAEETTFPVTVDNLTIEKAQIKWLSNDAGFNMLEMIDGLYDMQWQLDVAFSGKGYIAAGDIEIVMPAYIWKNRNDEEPSYVTMGIAEDDGNAKGDFAWKRVGDTVVITNIKKVSAGTKLMVQGTYRSKYDATTASGRKQGAKAMYDLHTVDPDAPYHGITDDLYAIINVNTQENNELLSGTTNTIKGSIDTRAYVTEAKKQVNGNVHVKAVPANIPSEFLPENSEDYYYVEWYVDGNGDGSQPFNMTFTDETADDYNGILLGATDRRGNNTKAENGTLDGFTQHYVWVAYPKSSFPEENTIYTLKNKLTVNVTGVDDLILTQKSTTAEVRFQTPVVWKIEKVWNYNEDKYDSSLEFRKENQPTSTPVWIESGGSKYFSDTLNGDNEWYTEWTDDGAVRNYSAFEHNRDITRVTHADGGSSSSDYWINSGTIGDRVYLPNGASYQKYWWYDHHKTVYDAENHKWTFYNDYHEGTLWSPGFVSSVYKNATNHTNDRLRATSDKDLVLLLNDKETTSISYSVYRKLLTLEYTMKRDGDPYDPDDVKQNDVRMEAVDHTEYFAGRKLNANEYYMYSVSLSSPTATDWEPNGSNNGRFSDGYSLPADLYGLVEGEWVKYAHLENGTITCENGAATSGNTVTFNTQDVKQVKVETVTNGATLAINYNVNVRLLPSEQIKNNIETAFNLSDYIMEKSKNDVTFTLYDNETNSKLNEVSASDTTYLHGRNYRLAVDLDKTCTQLQNNVNERYLKTTNTITLNQVSNITTRSEFDYAVEENLLPDSASGTFYDLLPPGMQADLSTLKIKNGKIKTQNIIENYKNTGRQLVVVTADIDHKVASLRASSSSNKYNDPTHPQYNGESTFGWEPATISFDSIYTWEEARNRGFSDLRNTAAYIADEDEFGSAKYWKGDKDKPDGENHTESLGAVIPSLRELMTDLKTGEDKPNTVYAGAAVGVGTYDFMAMTSLVKHVAITGSDNWSYGEDLDVNVAENGKYSYKITLTSGAQTTTKDIILLDALENYTPVKVTDKGDSQIAAGTVISQEEFELTNENLTALGKTPMTGETLRGWQGSFRSIDISEIKKMGVDAKIYYSTKPDINIVGYNPGNDPDKNTVPNILNNSGDWTDTLPTDPSTVTAIAIDCRKDTDGNDFELDEYQSLIAYVNMKAPNHDTASWAFDDEEYTNHLKNARAYNNVYMDVTQIDEIGLETHSYNHFDFTRVGIYSSKLTVTKEWDDSNDNDRMRPESVTVKLYADGRDTNKQAELSEDNNWSATFEYLPVNNDDGDMIYYTAKEDPVTEGYTSTSSVKREDAETTVKLTNKHDKIQIDVPFEKVWESEEENWQDEISTTIVVRLYKDGQFTGKKQTVRANADGEWKGKFTDLDKFDDGREIAYSVVEETVGNDWIMEQVSPTKIKNTYYPYGDLSVTKKVKNGTDAALDKSFTFTFSLENADGSVNTDMYDYVIKKEDETVREGNISHGETFTLKDGETITIKDIPTACTYTVTEESKSGFTLTSKTNDSGHVNANEAVIAEFTNTYSSVGKAEISGTKTLEGRALTRSQFQFQLCDEEGSVIRTASNKADGTFTFGDINFTHEDNGKTFTYIVKEVDRGRAGYTYDNRQYKVILSPVDNGDGTMTVGVDMKNIPEDEENVSSLSFANEYHASGEIILKAWKELKGRKLQNEEFEFELLDQNGRVFDTKKNAADGSITFDALEFTEKDAGNTYYYAIREKMGNDETVNYDENNYGYSVSVIDNGNGTLSFSQTPVDVKDFYKECETCQGTGTYTPANDPCDECNGSGFVKNPDWQSSEGELPVFKNTLKPGNLSISKKTQSGGDPEQEFNFKIKLIGDDVQDKQFDFEKNKIPYNAYLTYDANGGEFDDGETQNKFTYLVDGDNVSLTNGTYEEPVRDGYGFSGWFEDAECAVPFTGNPEELSLTTDKTVYAKWVEVVAYAVFDSTDRSLTFFRDVVGKYYDGKVVATKTYYTNVESTLNSQTYNNSPSWRNKDDLIKKVIFNDIVKPKSTSCWFYDMPNLTNIIGIENLDTSNVSNMSYMFDGCKNLTSLDLSHFNTSKVTNMHQMFASCSNLESLDLSHFDTSNVTIMGGMFRSTGLRTLDISNFDTSHVTNMGYMFCLASNLRDIDLSHFDTSNVTYTERMFYNTYIISTLNVMNDSFVEDDRDTFERFGGSLTLKYISPVTSDYIDWARNGSSLILNGGEGDISNVWNENNPSPAKTLTQNNTNSLFSVPKALVSKLKSLLTQNRSGGDGVTFENGEAEFTLKSNEKITFNDIPAGTAYQVYEETLDGWVLIEQRNVSGEIIPIETTEAEFVNKYQPGVATAQFSGTKTLDGVAADKDSFSFELFENDEVIETVNVLDGGFIQFPVITYEEAGTHTYIIREVDPNNDNLDWDTHEETVTVTVTDNGDGTLSSAVNYDSDGIKFENKTRPGTLKVKKNATGTTTANKDDEFTFKIMLNNDKGLPLSSDENIYWYKEDASGNVVRSLNPLNRLNAFLSGDDTKAAKVNSSEINGKAPVTEEVDNNGEEEADNKEISKSVKNAPRLLGNSAGEEDPYENQPDDIVPWTDVQYVPETYYNWPTNVEKLVSYKYRVTKDGILYLARLNGVGQFSSTENRWNSLAYYPKSSYYYSNLYRFAFTRGPWYNIPNIEKIVILEDIYIISATNTPTKYMYMPDVFGRTIKSVEGLQNLILTIPNTKGYSNFLTSDIYPDNDVSATTINLLEQCVEIKDLSDKTESGIDNGISRIRVSKNVEKLGIGDTWSGVAIFDDVSTTTYSKYSGYWVKESDLNERITQEQMPNKIREVDAQNTVWVREIKNTLFDASGGMIRSGDERQYVTLNKNDLKWYIKTPNCVSVYKPGYILSGWSDIEGVTQKKYSTDQNIIWQDSLSKLYAVWEYDGKNQINVNHYQETIDGNDYTLAETEAIRDTPGVEVTPQLKSYGGFYPESKVQTVTIDDEELVTVNYYYKRNRYNIKFDGNGATSGQMLQNVDAVGGISTDLPKNSFSKKGAFFTGWNTELDGTGTSFSDEQSVVNIGGNGDTVTLYAQWLENSNELTPSNGVIYVTCKAGETVVIPDLPDGTTYTIEEVNLPRGWEYVSGEGETGSIESNGTSSSQVNNKYKADGLVYLEAYKELEGNTVSSGQFTFELLNSSGTVLQTKSNGDIDENEQTIDSNGNTITNKWKGTAPVFFDAINYTEADIGKSYTYRIREVNTGDPQITYDTHTESVTVRVTDGGGGSVIATPTYDSTGPLFTNEVKTGTLRLTKDIVNSSAASESEEFEFEIHMRDQAGNPLEGDYPYRKEHFDYGTTTTSVTLYSHMENVDDTGKKLSNYKNSRTFNDVVTIPGAHALHVKIVYGGESASYDWVCMWQGSRPTYTAYSNYGSSITGKLGGGSYTSASNTKEYDVEGDTVTFAFRSDSSGVGDGYGYYAVITAEEVEVETGVSHSDIAHGETVTLRGGEVIEISGLPHGATYEIFEKDAPGWTQTGRSGADGTITAGDLVNAEFENTYSTTGFYAPKATKEFLGGNLSERSFDFELTDENGNLLSRGKTDSEGDITFTPIDYDQNDVGQTYYYYINEVTEDDDSIKWDKHKSEIKVDVVDDGKGNITAVSTNTNNNDTFSNAILRDLSISKETAGAMRDENKEFNFTLTFPQEIDYLEADDLVNEGSGVYTFALSHGQTMQISGIPYNTHYTVTEEDTEYDESVDGREGRSVSSNLTENTDHTFINTLDDTTPTGIKRSFFWGMLIIPLMIVFIIIKRIITR